MRSGGDLRGDRLQESLARFQRLRGVCRDHRDAACATPRAGVARVWSSFST